MANRPKVTQPVTNNKERALEQNRNDTGSRSAGPSRAAEQKTGGGHEKKTSKAPK
jgi:hypothetical protein